MPRVESFGGAVEGSTTCVLKSSGIKTGVWLSKIRVSQELQLSKEANVANILECLKLPWM